MKLNRFVLCLVALCLVVGLVSAQSYTYRIKGDHTGSVVVLDSNGTGYATDGTNTISFTWGGSQNQYLAHYWFWSVPFKLDRDGFVYPGTVLTSPSFPNDFGILQT
jgi:hypothetical protein